MDDSSFFMQWAMNTLDEHNSAAAADAYGGGAGGEAGGGVESAAAAAMAFPSLQALRSAAGSSQTLPAPGGGGVCVRDDLTVQVDYCSSWSSAESPGAGAGAGGAMEYDAAAAAAWSPHTARASGAMEYDAAAAAANRPMSWNFGAASAQPTAEVIALPSAAAATARGHTPAPAGNKRVGGSVVGRDGPAAQGVGASSSSLGPVQDHIIAERRRREKINQRFIELSTVIPGLKKMDKATILGDAVKYVRELQEKVKTMEEDESQRSSSTTIQSAVLVKKKHCPASSSGGDDEGGGGLPEIEARLSEKSVLVRIHCENARGLLVRLLAEVEDLRLAITHTSVMPFPAATAIITISAKVEQGFNSTVEEMVRRLNSVLRQHYSSSSSENSEKRSECYG